MKAIVDKDLCTGCGLCPATCPEVFEMQDDGKAGVIGTTVPEASKESCRQAADECPASAISVQD